MLALLAYGDCDPDCKNADGKTALHLAVEVCMHAVLQVVTSVVQVNSAVAVNIIYLKQYKINGSG